MGSNQRSTTGNKGRQLDYSSEFSLSSASLESSSGEESYINKKGKPHRTHEHHVGNKRMNSTSTEELLEILPEKDITIKRLETEIYLMKNKSRPNKKTI